MSSASFLVSPQELWPRLGTGEAPVILDVCRASIHDAMAGLIPTSTWRQPEAHEQWVQQLDGARPIVLACRNGHNLSQMVAADLRQRGLRAQVLEGGYQGWSEAGLPLVSKAAGLHAISFGLSELAGDDDHGMIERGFMVYDALFAWARHAAEERHDWPAKAA